MPPLLLSKLFVAIAFLLGTMSAVAQTNEKRDSSKAVLSYNNESGDQSSLQTFFREPVVQTDTCDFVIPFSRAGNLILIRARADTTEGSFILDTGAPGLILNMTYF